MAESPARDAEAAPAAAAAAPPAAGAADAPADGEDATDVILQMVAQARGMDRGQTEISRLQEQRRALANEKRALTRQLKNESRKRARLVQKSSKLSVPDLVQSLYIRQSRAAERERRAEERAAEREAGR